ncbi:U3 small nucleolar RNA-associated protein 6-domain-containing protein [Daedaleopsis nitida]|nr:U3 small nucleolar RNA-associated protein 6-domain-containing protein [Daedaleopsis nitida]
MERVQFQQEQMLAELKDLVQKGLFTQKEVKQIMQKRTTFETALVRRIPKKSDFLRYAAYEMSLEALRRKRAERLQLPKGPPSVSDYALVRRQFQIFERALKKFKGDVGLWIQYIHVAKKEGARALVGRITARALQLHPNVPALYVLAASHELDHLSTSAARALLQRGLRLNADSVDMWREYVRMEMGFVESLRRRWSVLGIDVKGKGRDTGSGKSNEKEREADDPWSGLGEDGGEKDASKMDVDVEETIEEDESARRQIMDGAIVKSVISSAVKAIPTIELFKSLHELIATYPCTTSLRDSLLDHLHALLHTTLPSVPAAIKLSATRQLTSEAVGEPLVDALKRANEQLSESVRSTSREARSGVACVYAEFLEEWCGKDVDDSLKAYLITSVHLLIQQLPAPVPPALLAVHVRLLTAHHASLSSDLLPTKVNTPEKILRVARKHTEKAPTCTTVWLARLGAERRFADDVASNRAWAEARKNVTGEDIQDVWLWGLEPQSTEQAEEDPDADVGLLEHLLHESQLIREPAAAGALHEVLLIRYAAATHRAFLYRAGATCRARSPASPASPAHGRRHIAAPLLRQRQTSDAPDAQAPVRPSPEARLARVRRIAAAYMPTARVWEEVFKQEMSLSTAVGDASTRESGASASHSSRGGGDSGPANGDGDGRVLRAVYEIWREKDGVEATIAWAAWLLRSGNGREAIAVVARTRSVLGATAGEEVERRWKRVLDGDALGWYDAADGSIEL